MPIRCIRIHTNIDLTKVRFNSVQYNICDLESKIYVPERNRLIVDTWLQYVRNKRTVVFCASVKHAEQIAELFRAEGIKAASVSGGMKQSGRKEFQDKFVNREIHVLCACDSLGVALVFSALWMSMFLDLPSLRDWSGEDSTLISS